MKKTFGFFLLIFLMLTAHSYAAVSWKPCTWKMPSMHWNSEDYGNRVANKLGVGASNLLLGWTELVTQPVTHHASGQELAQSLGRGLVNALGDTGGGALQVITFAFPDINVPLPEGGIKI